MIAGETVLRLAQCGTRIFFLNERLDFTFQLKKTRITFQNFFEMGRKFVRKSFLVEPLQALKIVDGAMVGRFMEESRHTVDG
jgi:hypothetical protein